MEEDREGDGSAPSCIITATTTTTTTTTARDCLVCAHACMCKIEIIEASGSSCPKTFAFFLSSLYGWGSLLGEVLSSATCSTLQTVSQNTSTVVFTDCSQVLNMWSRGAKHEARGDQNWPGKDSNPAH